MVPSRHSRRAMTLVELLVTISIIAVLMGIGLGVYWRMNRGLALQAAVSGIESALRAARAFAVHEHAPAMVVFRPRPDEPRLIGQVFALGRQTVSCWHFEVSEFAGTKVVGALGQEAVFPDGGEFHCVEGRIGSGVELLGPPQSAQVSSPYLDGLREGVFVECYVRPDAAGLSPGDVLPVVCKDSAAQSPYRLELVYDGSGYFALRAGVRVEAEGGSAPVVATSEPMVRPGVWSHVGASYACDGRTEEGAPIGLLALRLNGRLVAQEEATIEGSPMTLAPNTAPLHIGTDGGNYYQGRLDELKIGGLIAGEVFRLPKNAEAQLLDAQESDWRVHFDPEGKLDPRFHDEVVLVRVLSREDFSARVIRVNWLGSVEVFNGQPPEDE